MGNQNTKSNEKLPFTADELKILEASFKLASGHSDKLLKEKLLVAWSSIVDEHLCQCTSNYLYTDGVQHLASISLKRYSEPYYIVDRGTIDEKLNLLAGSILKTDRSEYAIKELEMYVASVIKSYLTMLAEQGTQSYECWRKHGYQHSERTIQMLSKGLVRNLTQDIGPLVTLDKLEWWLQRNPTFLILWREVFVYLYGKSSGKAHKLGGNPSDTNIFPVNEGVPALYAPILELPHVIFINSNLPNIMRHKWRFLFSSKIMGESFSTMLGKITKRGATLFIVEDEDHYVFGGYAPHSWSLGPNFVGDDTSMLFTLSPAMRCFNATGYNDHYQYLNLNQQTMPNGLGMGGQFNYWGLWLDREYGLGQSSPSCTTYQDYVQLSKRKDFRIRNLEVWGIGDMPKEGDDSDEDGEIDGKRSILNKNTEERAILELAGKQMHSDGLRDPDLDS